jgi:hypothetical protein
MFDGTSFSSGHSGLEAHVQELDERAVTLFPGLSDGRASARLRLRPDELTGRGVFLADGYRPDADTVLALYFGCVVAGWTTGDYVLALPSFRKGRRTWHPSVDAAASCRTSNPPLCNAALFDHSCHDATVALRRPAELRGCPLPCAAAFPTAALRPGGRLLWDYDGGSRRGNNGFPVDLACSLELRGEGVDFVPCACRGLLACPQGRWFRVFPGGVDRCRRSLVPT